MAPSHDRLSFREALCLVLIGGAAIGIVEVWLGLVGGWAAGRQWLLLGASIASGIAVLLPIAILQWFTGVRSKLLLGILAPLSGGFAGLVFSLVYGKGAISKGSIILGAVMMTLAYVGWMREERRREHGA